MLMLLDQKMVQKNSDSFKKSYGIDEMEQLDIDIGKFLDFYWEKT